MDEDAGVARERPRIAGDIDEAPRPFGGQRLDDLHRAVARRIDEHLVERAPGVDARLEEVDDLELRDEAVGARILARAGDERRAALEPHYLRSPAGDGQREIAQAAEKIRHALAGP